MQAGAALLAVVVATPALWVTVATYQDQIRVTEAQLEATQLERRRYDERYAARVSYWSDWAKEPDGFPYEVMKLQNRAPVPISSVTFVTQPNPDHRNKDTLQPEPGFVAALDAPPCSILTFQLIWVSPELEDIVAHWAAVEAVQFHDSLGWWERRRDPSPGAGEFENARPIEYADTVRHHWWRHQPAGGHPYRAREVGRESIGDCGEAG
ncbi:hypothetical protein ABZ652_24195 [Micromonospora chalcea]|uniref:hypothetical protein n=1 Tax=Micromonospora chalcea TaxID=1874 RepID=UPI0004C31730|nr:hypothetical protein [Micromonospora purpureochromogenes]